MNEWNGIQSITDTPSPRPVCPDPHVHESRLVKSPTPASRRSTLVVSRPRVTTRQIHPLCLLVSRPTPRRRARRSIASRARVAFVAFVVDRVRVRVARTNEYTNENLHVPSTPRVGARRRRPRENERTEIRRSTNPRSTIRALDATARGAESAIDRGRRESRATRAMRETSMRTNRCDRTNDGVDRSMRRVVSRTRLDRMTRATARVHACMNGRARHRIRGPCGILSPRRMGSTRWTRRVHTTGEEGVCVVFRLLVFFL